MSQVFIFGGEEIYYAFKIKSALIPLWARKCAVSGRLQKPGVQILNVTYSLCDLGQIT